VFAVLNLCVLSTTIVLLPACMVMLQEAFPHPLLAVQLTGTSIFWHENI
jgi:hypothetical protein